jgi:hypothetical protein
MVSINMAELMADIVSGDEARLRTLLPPTGDPAEDALIDIPHRTTPLMLAAACGREAVIELLLQCGADPSKRDAAGRTAAAYARAAGHQHLGARLDTVVDKDKTIW